MWNSGGWEGGGGIPPRSNASSLPKSQKSLPKRVFRDLVKLAEGPKYIRYSKKKIIFLKTVVEEVRTLSFQGNNVCKNHKRKPTIAELKD